MTLQIIPDEFSMSLPHVDAVLIARIVRLTYNIGYYMHVQPESPLPMYILLLQGLMYNEHQCYKFCTLSNTLCNQDIILAVLIRK